MVTGFSNERTSEYMILNDLYGKMKDKCKYFYPFFFHKNRDDTILSLHNDVADLHFIVCFSRRPKTNAPFSEHTYISFRQSLFDHASFFHQHGIPVIVGSPLGTSIENIGFGSECQWFQIQPGVNEQYIVYRFMQYDIDTKTVIKGIELLDDDNLNKLLLSAPILDWNEIVQLLRSWYEHYQINHPRGLFYSIPGQKPIFIVYRYDNLCTKEGLIINDNSVII